MTSSQRAVDWAPRARSDVVRYLTYVARYDAAAARRIKIAVDSKSEWLVDFPHAGSPVDGGRRKIRVAGSPLSIVYHVRSTTIRIIRILHERQDWR